MDLKSFGNLRYPIGIMCPFADGSQINKFAQGGKYNANQ